MRKIRMSEIAALHGRPDRSLFHEIKHDTDFRKKTKLARRMSGFTKRFWYAFALKRGVQSAYEKYMSQDESVTWAYDRELARRAARQLAAQARVTDQEFHRLKKAFKSGTDAVFDDLLTMNWDTAPFRGYQWSSITRRGELKLSRLHFAGRFDRDVIPEDLIRAELPEAGTSPRERRAFFKTRLGRNWARALYAQLKAMRRDYVLRQKGNFSLEEYALNAPDFWLGWYGKTEEIRSRVYRALLAETFAPRLTQNGISPLWAEAPIPQSEEFDSISIDFSKHAAVQEKTLRFWVPEGMPAGTLEWIRPYLEPGSATYRHVRLSFSGPKGLRALDLEMTNQQSTLPPIDYAALLAREDLKLVGFDSTELSPTEPLETPLNFLDIRNRVRLTKFLAEWDRPLKELVKAAND